ncbi:hypothetical protein BJV77DRAFT_623046 [Russula vinacea]|nr:hypothetical protein BJV77DRAFT_623046 [Russula vinacea]
MVKFHDPNVIQSEAAAVGHISYVLEGIFLWELVTTMNFEWKYVTAERKFKWPLLLHSTCRGCALITVICSIISSNITHEINCQLLTSWNLIFVCGSLSCASLLITIRVVAIWSHNHFVMAVTIAMCVTNIGFLIYGIATIRCKWSNVSKTCILENSFQGRYNIPVTMATDVAQLIIMLIGLLRSRREKRGFLRYLYIQGFIWLVAATLAETPSAVFIELNLNDPMNMMFQTFSFYTMIICATRMYRDLIFYDMDVNKNPHGPKVVSSLQFGAQPRKGQMALPRLQQITSMSRFLAQRLRSQFGRESDACRR